jgi:transcriptional regulator GlxA family with amidase domain
MGLSPINYLLKVRIERAREFLTDTDIKVADVALNVGFSNQQRFNEIFKKYSKTTPLQFRKSSRLKSPNLSRNIKFDVIQG